MNTPFIPVTTGENQVANRWLAFLHLHFAPRSRGVRLVSNAHQGPLYVQKPFYPEGPDTPHVYILHPPGGLVSGDELDIQITAAENSHAVITMPGAGRLYKARLDQIPQQQTIRLTIAQGASLEWLPLETIFFPGAHAELDTRIELEEGAHVVFWDVLCLGLPANDRTFSEGALNQKLSIYQQGQLKIQERLVINDTNRSILTAKAGLQGYSISGTMVCGSFGEKGQAVVDRIRSMLSANDLLAAVTLIDGFVLVRSLAHCSEKVRRLFEQIWAVVRPELMDKEACAPRIWQT